MVGSASCESSRDNGEAVREKVRAMVILGQYCLGFRDSNHDVGHVLKSLLKFSADYPAAMGDF